MREIEFRGKREDNGEWVYGDLVHDVFVSQSGDDVRIIAVDNSYNKFVIPATVGQYTGLKDKNGVRIFEGDIVKDDNTIGAVSYKNCAFEFAGHSASYCKWEVIGNIHDNPELLKGESNEV